MAYSKIQSDCVWHIANHFSHQIKPACPAEVGSQWTRGYVTSREMRSVGLKNFRQRHRTVQWNMPMIPQRKSNGPACQNFDVNLLPLLLTCVCVCVSRSVISFFATPWTVACQAPLSMEFSRQEYWSRLPFPSPGDLSHPGLLLRPRKFCIWPALILVRIKSKLFSLGHLV